MALDLSRFNFFKRLDARGRIFFLLAAVVVTLLVVYLLTRMLSGSEKTTGPSRVASAPAGLQSVQGGQLTPEYERALQQANTQAAQQAQMTGGSAVPTVINYGIQSSANCNIICSDQSVNIKNDLDNWVKQGSVSPDVAAELERMADDNVPVSEFANALDQLVKQGKLTPEQARQLLEDYKKQHANALLQDSAKGMDGLIKSGDLPLDVASQLLEDQKKGMTPAQYAAELQRLVAEGKISPEVAQQLLAQYTKQKAAEAANDNLALIKKMLADGEITPDVAKQLSDLVKKGVSAGDYAAALQADVAAGKLTPAAAAKLLAAYESQKAAVGPVGTVNQLLQKAEDAAYQEISDLLKTGQMTPEVAAQLRSMIQKNVSMADFQTAINNLVAQKKMTPQIAQLKLADYKQVSGLRALAARLAALQAENASPAEVAAELKRAVQDGLISPEEAAELMKEYDAINGAIPAPTPIPGTGNDAFSQLQQRVQQNAVTQPAQGLPTASEFAVAPNPAEQAQAVADQAARINNLIGTMSGQAAQLVASWAPPTMAEKAGSAGVTTTTASTTTTGANGAAASSSTTSTTTTSTSAPLIKAGTILFAVLDTEANSDYPDSPIMATVVAGDFKGAKLLGKLTITKSISGQMDRISLNFTMMNEDVWTDTKTVTAYAIDPDTARTVLATSVNYHYLMRFGATMATSFLQGFSSAITSSGSTVSQGFTGTTTTSAALGASDKIWVGFGQIGQTLGAATQNYVNIPPTVKVASGVGLGILFMADVT